MLLLRRVCSTTSLRLIGPWRPIASSTAKARDTAGARSTFAVLVLERLSTVLRLRHGRPILARMPAPGRAGHDRYPARGQHPPATSAWLEASDDSGTQALGVAR